MRIRFACSACGHKLRAAPEQAGKACKCTRCGHAMTIPGSPPGTSGAPAAGQAPQAGRAGMSASRQEGCPPADECGVRDAGAMR